MMNEPQLPLSPDGMQRRDQIAQLARIEARRRRRRRLIGKSALTCAIGLLAASVWMTIESRLNLRQKNGNPSIAVLPSSQPAPQIDSRIEIAQIQTDPTIADRLSLKITPHWRTIGDDELLRELADAGKPAGLVRFDGQTLLLPHKPSHQ